MYKLQRSASAPELYERSSETQLRTKSSAANDNSSYSSGIEPSSDSRKRREIEYISYEEENHRRRLLVTIPTRLAYISYSYMLLAMQLFLSMVHWLFANYSWQPSLTIPHQCLYVLLLLLTWLNLTLSFLGFRRLQVTSPINWIVFVGMFESLTLLIICVYVRDLDLAWYNISIGIAVILFYTPLGIFWPSKLSANLWILVFVSLSVMLISIVALFASLAMHVFLPMIVCIALFGPWTMHNAAELNVNSRNPYLRYNFMEMATKMYITYSFTVGGLIIVNRLTNGLIEAENCKGLFFCQKRSPTIEYEPEN